MCYEPLDPRDEAELGTDDEEPLDEDCPVCCYGRDFPSTPGKAVKHLEQRHWMRMSPVQRAARDFIRMAPAEMARCQISASAIAATIGAAAAETAEIETAARAAREAKYRSIEEPLQEQKLWDEMAMCWKYGTEADSYSRFMIRTFEVATTNVPLVDVVHDKTPSQCLRDKIAPSTRKPRPLTPREREVIFCWIFRPELSKGKLPEFLGISPWTYNGYRYAIESKLGARDRTHAATIILAQFIKELQISPY